MNRTDTPKPDSQLSNEMHDLISYRPNWVIRKGNTIFVLIIVSLVTITWFVKYPDFVSGSMKLVAIDAPKPAQTLYYGQMFASQNDIRKIRKGQRVLIWVKGYPGSKFGYLPGIVNFISEKPTASDSLLVKVDLPAGLKTNYNKLLFFKNDLTAEAEIVADDRRFIDRVFSKFNVAKP